LSGLGIAYRQVVSGVDEDHNGLDPESGAKTAALAKARAVAAGNRDGIVIGADTVVVSPDGELLGKPADEAEAVHTLMKLAGRTHTVITAIAVIGPGEAEETVAAEHSAVTMRPFTEAEARRYVASGEPMDKAGAYGIQLRGALLVERVEGCYFNVVGLPLVLLKRLLQERGVDTDTWLGPEPSPAEPGDQP
jgi:septum formation protein